MNYEKHYCYRFGNYGKWYSPCFAQFGFDVTLVDISKEALAKGIQTISKNLDRQVTKGAITADDKSATLARINPITDLALGVKNAELVVEAATENVDLKLKIFREIDANAPSSCILASNTSSISITKIAAVTKRAEQVIGMHFMNPVPVMKLIEVIRGYSTSDEVTQIIMELSKN